MNESRETPPQVDIDGLFGPDPAVVADAVASTLADISTTLALPPTIPDRGMAPSEALSLVTPYVRGGGRNLGDPGFMAHMDPPTPWVSWVACLLSASANQNLLHPDTAPAARELERTVLDWLSPVFGMSGGHLVPGSTVANLTSLWAARDITGARTVVASTDSHLSVRKAAAILGLDYRAVAVPAEDWPDPLRPRALSVDDLATLFEAGGDGGLDPSSTIVVLTAGSTGTGSIDQLDLSPLAKRPAWVHVDAAWAGPLRFSAHYAERLRGLEEADSVAVSGHKWLHQPKESAMVLFSDVEAANRAVSVDGAYLQVPNVGLLGSRGASAAPLAATLLVLGAGGMADLVDRGMATADELLRRIEAADRLVALGPNVSGVVAWRHLDHDSSDVQTELGRQIDGGAFVSTVAIDGVTWLRSVAANPMADPERVVRAVLAAADRLGGLTVDG